MVKYYVTLALFWIGLQMNAQSLEFDGIDDIVEVRALGWTDDIELPFTMEFIFQSQSSSSAQVLLYQEDSTGMKFIVGLNSIDNSPFVQYGDEYFSPEEINGIDLFGCVHLTLVFTPLANSLDWYINGIHSGTSILPVPTPFFTGLSYYLGSDPQLQAGAFLGRIEEYRVIGKAFSINEINQWLFTKFPKTHADKFSLFPFDDNNKYNVTTDPSSFIGVGYLGFAQVVPNRIPNWSIEECMIEFIPEAVDPNNMGPLVCTPPPPNQSVCNGDFEQNRGNLNPPPTNSLPLDVYVNLSLQNLTSDVNGWEMAMCMQYGFLFNTPDYWLRNNIWAFPLMPLPAQTYIRIPPTNTRNGLGDGFSAMTTMNASCPGCNDYEETLLNHLSTPLASNKTYLFEGWVYNTSIEMYQVQYPLLPAQLEVRLANSTGMFPNITQPPLLSIPIAQLDPQNPKWQYVSATFTNGSYSNPIDKLILKTDNPDPNGLNYTFIDDISITEVPPTPSLPMYVSYDDIDLYQRRITVDSQGNIIAMGAISEVNVPSSNSTVRQGNFPTQQLGPVDHYTWIAKYDQNGNNLWFQVLGHLLGYGIDLDANDNIYVVGKIPQGAPSAVYNGVPPGVPQNAENAFVAMLNSNGTLTQTRITGSQDAECFTDIKIDKASNHAILVLNKSGNLPIFNWTTNNQPTNNWVVSFNCSGGSISPISSQNGQLTFAPNQLEIDESVNIGFIASPQGIESFSYTTAGVINNSNTYLGTVVFMEYSQADNRLYCIDEVNPNQRVVKSLFNNLTTDWSYSSQDPDFIPISLSRPSTSSSGIFLLGKKFQSLQVGPNYQTLGIERLDNQSNLLWSKFTQSGINTALCTFRSNGDDYVILDAVPLSGSPQGIALVGNFEVFDASWRFDLDNVSINGVSNYPTNNSPTFICRLEDNGPGSSYYKIMGEDAINGVDEKIVVFPNPGDDNIQIRSPRSIHQIELVTLSGKVIFNELYGNSETEIEIDTEDVPSGVYLIKLVTESDVRFEYWIKE